MWQYHPILLVFQLGALISVGVAVYCAHRVWRHGYSLVVVSVGLLAFFNAVYNTAATLKVASPTLPVKLWMYKLEFVGTVVNPSVAIVLMLAYLGYERWLTRPVIGVLGTVPVVILFLIMGNPGNVMIVEPTLVTVDGLYALEHEFPPLFLTHLAWGYGAFLVAALFVGYEGLAGAARRVPALLISVALLLPLLVNTLKMTGVYPPGGEGINPTPAASTASLALVALAIVRYRLFDLLPVGRSQATGVMDDGYVLADATGEIVDANPAARALLGTSSLTGRSARAVLPVSEVLDDAPEPVSFAVQDRILQIRASPVRDATDSAGRVFILRDITTLREREEALQRENERLDRFVGVVSHDLRNPLNVATGRLELAQDEVQNEHLQAVDRSLGRMRRLVDDLLVLARQGASLEADDLDAVALGERVQTAWRHVDTARARLRLETTQQISAAEGRLQQLLENLIRNAVEHADPAVTVTIGALDDGFYVEDDGPGIPPETRETVFESGYTTNDAGTGFGLSIVQEIADAHGWTVTVAAGENGGARFEITGVEVLGSAPPGDDEGASGDENSSPSNAPTAPANEGPSSGHASAASEAPDDALPPSAEDLTTVLVVDDDVDMRRYVRDLLTPTYEVMEAADGERGLERARSALPDLIVSDVMMPERDGFSMLKALRQNPQTSCVPVVMLTARAEETAQVTGLETGADAYVTKPFDADVLTAHVDRLLTARRQLRERIREEEEVSESASDSTSLGQSNSFERRVRTAVRTHLSDPDFSVADLADAVALSRGHLTDKVKAELGQTPSALLRSMRLKKGAELLVREEGTVTEIAYAVGFNSLSYFSRCFKDEFGVPPSAYRTERA